MPRLRRLEPWSLVLVGSGTAITGVGAANFLGGRGGATMALLALAVAAGVLVLAWRVDPAWTLSAALLLSVMNGRWGALGLPAFVPPDRLVLALGLAMLLVRAPGARDRPPIELRSVHGVLAATACLAVGSAIAADTLALNDATYRLVDRLGIVPFVLFLLAPVAFRTAHQRAVLLSALVALGGYLGLTALFETIGPSALVFPRYILNPDVGIHFGRARGPFTQAAINGMSMYACGIAAVIGAVSWRARWARAGAIAVVLACSVGLILTLQRSIWLGAPLATFVTLFAFRELRPLLVPAVAACIALVAVSLAFVPGLAERAEARKDAKLSVWDRQNSNTAAGNMAAAHPLLGVGWGRFALESGDYFELADDYPVYKVPRKLIAHNVFLSNAAELGLVGTTLWLGGIVLGVGGALVSRGPPELRPWRIGLFAFFLLWVLVANLSPLANVLPNALLWLWAGIVASREVDGSEETGP